MSVATSFASSICRLLFLPLPERIPIRTKDARKILRCRRRRRRRILRRFIRAETLNWQIKTSASRQNDSDKTDYEGEPIPFAAPPRARYVSYFNKVTPVEQQERREKIIILSTESRNAFA